MHWLNEMFKAPVPSFCVCRPTDSRLKEGEVNYYEGNDGWYFVVGTSDDEGYEYIRMGVFESLESAKQQHAKWAGKH